MAASSASAASSFPVVEVSNSSRTSSATGSPSSRTIRESVFWESFQWICRMGSPGTYVRNPKVSLGSCPGWLEDQRSLSAVTVSFSAREICMSNSSGSTVTKRVLRTVRAQRYKPNQSCTAASLRESMTIPQWAVRSVPAASGANREAESFTAVSSPVRRLRPRSAAVSTAPGRRPSARTEHSAASPCLQQSGADR